MKRTTLSPRDAAWLTQTLDRNRRLFGGFSMEGDPTKDPDKKDPDPKPTDEPLGDAGKKALETEREARKKAEADLAALRGDFDQFRTTLGEAFGVKPTKGDDGTETLKKVQEQLTTMQHEAAVLRVANTHSITDKDDLALLEAAKDADAMEKLATRLAKTGDVDDKGNPTPKPDLTQGGKGDPTKPETLPGVPRMAAAFEEQLATK